MSGSGCSILMPSERIACTVRRQSSLGRKPRRTQTPLVNAPIITARCEMLLSPGTAISASMRGARLMRNSMSDAQHRDKREPCPAPPQSLPLPLPLPLSLYLKRAEEAEEVEVELI